MQRFFIFFIIFSKKQQPGRQGTPPSFCCLYEKLNGQDRQPPYPFYKELIIKINMF